MQYVADLHIHSRYSRATSKSSDLHGLAAWAGVKGIQVIGTGDFTHPAWFSHLADVLEEAEPGFFRIRQGRQVPASGLLPLGLEASVEDVRFVLTAEISSIYKRGGRVRKVHNILFAPDLASVQAINRRLAAIGNLESDGRPILGLDSRDLLEILLEQAPGGFLVPAHIWTPWFSLFGSKSGFDALEECFGDLSQEVFALETGLSSDPEMNRMVSALDRYTLISNSDCHSPGKLGREANIFDTGFDFPSLRSALQQPRDAQGKQRFAATVEFYPEEGKYHCDGHRKCGVCLEPEQSRRHGNLCPVCGRPLTIGVLHRVLELADRATPLYPKGSPVVHSLIPLPEILAELLAVGSTSKRVMRSYVELIRGVGSEFDILLKAPIAELKEHAGELFAEAIRRVRTGRVHRQPGFDGQFGVIKVFSPRERDFLAGQLELFARPTKDSRPKAKQRRTLVTAADKQRGTPIRALNPEQDAAVRSNAPVLIVQAGPGTGKTHTLIGRVVRFARRDATACTVITFTNKAVDEVAQRLAAELGEEHRVRVTTFHRFCLRWIRELYPEIRVAGPEQRLSVLRRLFAGANRAEVRQIDEDITRFLLTGQAGLAHEQVRSYFRHLDDRGWIDIEAVVPCAVRLLRSNMDLAHKVYRATGHLFLDEFQDVNRSQYQLVRLLAGHCTIFAIGDPDQAIYGFRGADPAYFSRCIDELQAEVHTLVRNYRSGTAILRASGAMIQGNPAPGRKAMLPHATQKGQVMLCSMADPAAEAVFVARRIEELIGGLSHRSVDRIAGDAESRMSFRDIGILYRVGRQAEVIEAELRTQGIPVQTVDRSAFYTTGSCRVIYLWLLTLAGKADDGMLLELLGLEAGIGGKTLGSLEQVLEGGASPAELLAAASVQATPVVHRALERFRQRLATLGEHAGRRDLQQIFSLLCRDYQLELQAGGQEAVARLLRLACSLSSSVEEVAAYLLRFSDSTVYDAGSEAVVLSTMHAAKGLEFKAVFLVGLEDELCPLAPRAAMGDELQRHHLEEERRLLYVGMTRAEDVLYLSWCASRTINGKQESRTLSPFIEEIRAEHVPVLESATKEHRIRKPRQRQLRLF